MLVIRTEEHSMATEKETPQCIILKLGGSLITQKDTDKAEIATSLLKELVQEVAQVCAVKPIELVIVHGTGSFGHVPAKKYVLPFLDNPKELSKGIALTKLSLQELNYAIVKELVEANINAVAFSPSSAVTTSNGCIQTFNLRALKELLNKGLVPVLHGDCVVDLQKGFSILSSDTLAVYLAVQLQASRVLLAMDYNGVFDRDPASKESKKIDVMTRDQLMLLEHSKTRGTDLTGGIKKKVEELFKLSYHGIEAEIIGGKNKGYLKRALLGERGLGTLVR